MNWMPNPRREGRRARARREAYRSTQLRRRLLHFTVTVAVVAALIVAAFLLGGRR